MQIDTQRRAGIISPFLFGHNLEHTRRCLWGGLCAQLVRNRKFAAGPSPDGISRHWQRVGPPGAMNISGRPAANRAMPGRP